MDLTQAVPVVIGGTEYLIPQAPGPDPIQLTLLSSMFMHGSLLHLGGNMLFLWIFGDNVEHRAGPLPYLVAYLAAGVVGSLAQTFSDPTRPSRRWAHPARSRASWAPTWSSSRATG